MYEYWWCFYPNFRSWFVPWVILWHHCVHTISEAHPASYPMWTRGPFPCGKAAGALSSPLTYLWCWGRECLELYPHSSSTPLWRDAQEKKKHRNNFINYIDFLAFKKLPHVRDTSYCLSKYNLWIMNLEKVDRCTNKEEIKDNKVGSNSKLVRRFA